MLEVILMGYTSPVDFGGGLRSEKSIARHSVTIDAQMVLNFGADEGKSVARGEEAGRSFLSGNCSLGRD